MELQNIAIAQLHEHLGASAETAEHLPPQICIAAEAAFNCLINDSKILVCGDGHHGANAGHLYNALTCRHSHQQPALPVINITGDAMAVNASIHQLSYQKIFANPINAIGHAGDLLILLSGPDDSSAAVSAIKAAQGKGMQIIAISTEVSEGVAPLLTPEDICIKVPGDQFNTILQQQLTVILLISELINIQLFGSNRS